MTNEPGLGLRRQRPSRTSARSSSQRQRGGRRLDISNGTSQDCNGGHVRGPTRSSAASPTGSELDWRPGLPGCNANVRADGCEAGAGSSLDDRTGRHRWAAAPRDATVSRARRVRWPSRCTGASSVRLPIRWDDGATASWPPGDQGERFNRLFRRQRNPRRLLRHESPEPQRDPRLLRVPGGDTAARAPTPAGRADLRWDRVRVVQRPHAGSARGSRPTSSGCSSTGRPRSAWPRATGFLCVGGLFHLTSTLSNASGTAAFSLDLTQPPDIAAQIDAGETWNFQSSGTAIRAAGAPATTSRTRSRSPSARDRRVTAPLRGPRRRCRGPASLGGWGSRAFRGICVSG